MHPDLKHFYECTIDIARYGNDEADYNYSRCYKYMLDTHPHCEELLDTFAELTIDIYNGDTDPRKIQQMTEIEQTLDSCRLPF